MKLIEPCCTQKQLPALREKIGATGTTICHGYGDLSIAELLPVILTRYSETDMTFVCPVLPDAAAAVLTKWLKKNWARADGKGRADVLARLTLITDMRPRKSPAAAKWVKENPFPERLFLCNVQQNDTAILLPDIVFFGNMNLTYGGHFTAFVSTNKKVVEDFRATYNVLISKSQQ